MIYSKPSMSMLGMALEKSTRDLGEGRYSVSISSILGAVQQAYSDAGLESAEVADIKARLFKLANNGEIEKLIYHAILDLKKHVDRNA